MPSCRLGFSSFSGASGVRMKIGENLALLRTTRTVAPLLSVPLICVIDSFKFAVSIPYICAVFRGGTFYRSSLDVW